MNLRSNGAIASAGIVGMGLIVVGSYAMSHRRAVRNRRARKVPSAIANLEDLSAATTEEVAADSVTVGKLQRRTLVLINKVSRRDLSSSS